jgi:hypothetical protein
MKSIMVRIKKKNIYLPLVFAGYTLFTLLVIEVLLSTVIPYTRMLFTPGVLYYNVIAFLIAFVVGSLLPAYLGYVIGDHAVKSKGKMSHHFSGVLFGLLAYWIVIAIGAFVSIPSEWFGSLVAVRVLSINIFWSVVVFIVTSILAIGHVRSRQAKHNLLEYKPYRAVLYGMIALVPIVTLVRSIVTNSFNAYLVIPFVMIIIFGGIVFATLRKSNLKTADKVAWSAVSLSVAYVAVFVASQLAQGVSYYVSAYPTMEFQSAVNYIGFAVAIIGWLVYWRAQRKVLL